MTPEAQTALNERAYLELLEDCSEMFNKKKQSEEQKVYFSKIYSPMGHEILTIDNLKRFISKRVS
jgi:hemolysin-activating ACP:hemolysin acyltransferase